MNLPSVILVPTDFGDASERALAYAVELAKRFGAEVVLLHSFEIPLIGFPDGAMVATAELTSRIIESAQESLDKAVASTKSSGVAVRSVLHQGDPWQRVLSTIEEVSANLVVMGTHGRRGLPRALLGSVAEKVVRTAPTPVLIVHADDVDASPARPEAASPGAHA
jgi:nucleotide-binding universal stress UspA family protein